MKHSDIGRDDQEREVAALSLAQGSGDPAAEELLQRRKIGTVRGRIVGVAVGIVIGVAVVALLSHRGATAQRSGSVAHWRTVAGPALMIAGLVLEAVILVARFRSGQYKADRRSPALVLTRPQRRGLLRQIRGQADVDPSMLPVSRRLAEMLQRQRSMIGLFVALPMIFFGQALPHNTPTRWWLAIALSLLYGALAIPVLRDSRRAERFLAEHPW